MFDLKMNDYNVHLKKVTPSELSIYRKMSEKGVAPKIISYSSCSGGDFCLITERSDGDLRDLRLKTKEEKEEAIRQIDAKIKILHKSGYGHGDLHGGNIVYKYCQEDNTYQYYLIDFEHSYLISQSASNWKLRKWMLNNFIPPFTNLQKFLEYDYIQYKQFL